MSLLALWLVAAAATVPPAAVPVTPAASLFAPATIDNSMEIEGEALAADQRRKRLFIEVRVNDSGPHRFLVDSGADRSVISDGLADRLGLPTGDPVRVQGMAGAQQVTTVRVETLGLGQSQVGPFSAPALSSRHIGADGLIGIDALADQRLLLDFDRRTVTVQDSRRGNLSAGAGEIVVTARRRKGQLIITQASVNRRDVAAVIDTGSEVTLANMALRRRLFGDTRPEKMEDIELVSVTGQVLKAEAIVLNNVRIGGLWLDNVVVAFADAPPFALFGLAERPALFLGSDLLASFRRVALDFGNRKVRFVPR